MPKIIQLSPHIANLIAAGEVVERPASVVKELLENAVDAGASKVTVEIRDGGMTFLRVTDNGCGMTPQQVDRVTDPFYTTRTTRKVGLGTALFRQTAELAGGSFRVWSEPGKGTEVTAELNPLHLDAVPMGDLGGTYGVLVQTSPGVELVLHAVCDGREFTADTRQFREILGDVPLDTPEVIAFLTEFVRENFAEILRGSPLA